MTSLGLQCPGSCSPERGWRQLSPDVGAGLLGLPADASFVHLQETSVGYGLRVGKEGLERR